MASVAICMTTAALFPAGTLTYFDIGRPRKRVDALNGPPRLVTEFGVDAPRSTSSLREIPEGREALKRRPAEGSRVARLPVSPAEVLHGALSYPEVRAHGRILPIHVDRLFAAELVHRKGGPSMAMWPEAKRAPNAHSRFLLPSWISRWACVTSRLWPKRAHLKPAGAEFYKDFEEEKCGKKVEASQSARFLYCHLGLAL